tara:strand:- start:195 stop:380 length:186 start_codon:yes stop_codon:yes gene_type:complete
MSKELTNDVLVAVRMPRALQAHAKEMAKAQHMSQSAFYRQGVKRNIESYLINERKLVEQFV